MAEEKLYIAFDSDILIKLADCEYAKNTNKISREMKEETPDFILEQVEFIWNKIKDGKIVPYITTTVYNETKTNPKSVDFMKKYAVFPSSKALKNKTRQERIKKLANAYCESKGKFSNMTPMIKKYSAYTQEWVPVNDAVHMAEASVDHVYVVTGNAKDYIYYENRKDRSKELKMDPKKLAQEKAVDIIVINKKLGVGIYDEDGQLESSRPFSFNFFAVLIKDKGVAKFTEKIGPRKNSLIAGADFLP